MRIKRINTVKFELAILFICGLLACVSVVAAPLEFSDAKSKSVYEKINAKIAKLRSEREIKISRIKAKKYSPAAEKAKIAKIDLKIDRAIQRYKEKGRAYFRRLGVPDPWRSPNPRNIIHPKKVSEKPLSTAIKQPTSVLKRRQVVETPPTRDKEMTKSAKIAPARNPNTMPSKSFRTSKIKRVSTPSPVERRSDPAIDNRKISSVSPSKPYNSSEKPKNVIQVSAKKSSSHFAWKVFAAVASSFFFFLAAITVVANIATWKKRKNAVRIALGCGTLCFGFLSLATILVTGYVFSFMSSADRPSKAEKRIDSYMVENAANWQDLGANLFAEAVVEGDRDKLFKAIGYLEKAYAGAPDNKGITVDLADAYMEVNSPSLTALAIELYESIFDSFDDDPLVARLAAGYFQLKNCDVALLLAKERVKRSTEAKLLGAAMQLTYIAAAARKEDSAISTLRTSLQRSPQDPALLLIIATLQDSKGDKKAVLETLDSIVTDEKIEVKFRKYAETMKKRVGNE